MRGYGEAMSACPVRPCSGLWQPPVASCLQVVCAKKRIFPPSLPARPPPENMLATVLASPRAIGDNCCEVAEVAEVAESLSLLSPHPDPARMLALPRDSVSSANRRPVAAVPCPPRRATVKPADRSAFNGQVLASFAPRRFRRLGPPSLQERPDGFRRSWSCWPAHPSGRSIANQV